MACFLQDQAVPQEVIVNTPAICESQCSCADVFKVKSELQEWKLLTENFTLVMFVVIKEVTTQE